MWGSGALTSTERAQALVRTLEAMVLQITYITLRELLREVNLCRSDLVSRLSFVVVVNPASQLAYHRPDLQCGGNVGEAQVPLP